MTTLFDDVLRLRPQAVQYEVQRRLTEEFPGRFVMMTRSELFDPHRFVYEKQATMQLNPDVMDVLDYWPGDDVTSRYTVSPRHRRETMTWNDQQFEILTITLRENNDFETMNFIVGDTRSRPPPSSPQSASGARAPVVRCSPSRTAASHAVSRCFGRFRQRTSTT